MAQVSLRGDRSVNGGRWESILDVIFSDDRDLDYIHLEGLWAGSAFIQWRQETNDFFSYGQSITLVGQETKHRPQCSYELSPINNVWLDKHLAALQRLKFKNSIVRFGPPQRPFDLHHQQH